MSAAQRRDGGAASRLVNLAPRHKMGLTLANPVMLAAGVAGYGDAVLPGLTLGRLGGIVTAPVTRRAWRGDLPQVVETTGGLLWQRGLCTMRCVEAMTDIGYSAAKLFMISCAVPVLPKVSLAVSSEQKKISTSGRICSICLRALSPFHRFPRKFTSNEISAPFFLKRRIISKAVSKQCSSRPSVIPEVWKHLVL